MKTLDDLLGEHFLSGVLINDTANKEASFVRFALDGCALQADELSYDEYRSGLGAIYLTDERVPDTHMFAPTFVVGRKRDDPSDDVLEFVNPKTGAVVLFLGTVDTDDYYPRWVAEFTPDFLPP